VDLRPVGGSAQGGRNLGTYGRLAGSMPSTGIVCQSTTSCGVSTLSTRSRFGQRISRALRSGSDSICTPGLCGGGWLATLADVLADRERTPNTFTYSGRNSRTLGVEVTPPQAPADHCSHRSCW